MRSASGATPGGTGSAGLADRRLQEAAIYLDDGTRAAEDEFAYLIINMESGASYETDFAVYEIGKTYGSFPKAEKLGYSFAGFRTSDGKTITENSIVNGNAVVTAAVDGDEVHRQDHIPTSTSPTGSITMSWS